MSKSLSRHVEALCREHEIHSTIQIFLVRSMVYQFVENTMRASRPDFYEHRCPFFSLNNAIASHHKCPVLNTLATRSVQSFHASQALYRDSKSGRGLIEEISNKSPDS